MNMILFALLTACDSATPNSNIQWSGYVYSRDLSGELQAMDTGSVELIDLDGEQLVSGTQPFENTPSYWRLTYEADVSSQEIAVRIKSPNNDTMLWRGTTPASAALWLNGTIYNHSQAYNTYFFSALSDLEIQPLSEQQVVHLWGQPLTPEDWAEATISITDGAGITTEALTIAYDEAGLPTTDTSEKIDLFFGVNLAPGQVLLQVSLPDGRSAETLYPAQAGDMLSAMYYTLPSN